MKRGEVWYLKRMINGQRFVVSTGFADRKSAERRASDIEHDIRAGIHGWKSTIPSFAEWWAIYKKTYTPLKSARNRDANIVAHFLPHFGAKRLDEITKSRHRPLPDLPAGTDDGAEMSGQMFGTFAIVVVTLRLR